ncbi:unnamed protein product, partial [Mesorhabditis belari]|uniref:Mitochondrial protein M19 n=1 Tax=Mesorhabditis belari TaxID=2138241 RepID=A0AAF3EPD6_9BILA
MTSRQASQYKQFLRLVAKWPQDPHKSAERNLAHHLELQIQRFRKDPTVFGDDPVICERRYIALERILNNEVLKQYPHDYVAGCFGQKLHQLQEINSENGRKYLGFDRESRWKTLWNKIFPKPSDFRKK